jgi:hypothetical protein
MASTEQRHKYKSTIRGRATVLIGNAKTRCKKKGIEFQLTLEWVEKHLNRGTCELTGIPFNLKPPNKNATRRPDAPSLDRINKNKNYTEENTRVILWAVNCALSEYGTEEMLPILKAMIIGIENAKPNTTPPVPKRTNLKGIVHSKHRSVLATGTGQDYDNPHHHSGPVQGQDINHRAKTGSGDSVGHRGQEVVALTTLTHREDHGDTEPEIVRLEFGRRYLSD